MALVLIMVSVLTIFPKTVHAGSGGTGGGGGGFGTEVGGTALPDEWDENVLVRFYPISCVETILEDKDEEKRLDYLSDLNKRWEFAGGFGSATATSGQGVYFTLPKYTGGAPYSGNKSLGEFVYAHPVVKGTSMQLLREKITPDVTKYSDIVTGDTGTFLSWVATGLRGGINLAGGGGNSNTSIAPFIGDTLDEDFYSNVMGEDMSEEEKVAAGDKFWESYFAFYLTKFANGQAQVDEWKELVKEKKLSMGVDLSYPIDVNKATPESTIRVYVGITDVLGVLSRTKSSSKVKYTKENVYYNSLTNNGSNPERASCAGPQSSADDDKYCKVAKCAATGHIPFTSSETIVAVGKQVHPKSHAEGNSPVAMPETYFSWGYYFIESEAVKGGVKLIEKHKFLDNGLVVKEDTVDGWKSWKDVEEFEASKDISRPCPEASAETTLVKELGGKKYEFKEYNYYITQIDPATEKEGEPLDPPGKTVVTEPTMPIVTTDLDNEESYKIYVEAIYEKVNEAPEVIPAPAVVKEYELSEFWENLSVFVENQKKPITHVRYEYDASTEDEYIVGENVFYPPSPPWMPPQGPFFEPIMEPVASPALSGLTLKKGNLLYDYLWKPAISVPSTMQFLDGSSKTNTWIYQKDMKFPSADTAIEVGYKPATDMGLWVNKGRVQEKINFSSWIKPAGNVPSELTESFKESFFPDPATVANYKMKNAGSIVLQTADTGEVVQKDVDLAGDANSKDSSRADMDISPEDFMDKEFDFLGPNVAIGGNPPQTSRTFADFKEIKISSDELKYDIVINWERYNPIENREIIMGGDALKKYVEGVVELDDAGMHKAWFTSQANDILKVHTEVDMTYDDYSGTVGDITVVGDVPRFYKPVSYHEVAIDLNRVPKVSSSTIPTDKRANKLAQRINGVPNKPVLYSGGNLNIGFDNKELITVDSFMVDVEEPCKTQWAYNKDYSVEKIHDDFKDNVSVEINADLLINDKEMLLKGRKDFNFLADAQITNTVVQEYTLEIRGKQLVDQGGLSDDMVSKLKIKELIEVFAEKEGIPYDGDGSANLNGGENWYTEDCTTLVVKRITDTLSFDNSTYAEKVPITLSPPTPKVYNNLFSTGYDGKIDMQYILKHKRQSLSPYTDIAEGGTVLLNYDRTRKNDICFVISDASVLDMRQGRL